MDPRNEDRLVGLWVKIARRYKEEPAVAAYDLLNEPLPARTGAAAGYKDRLEPLYKRIFKAIRAVSRGGAGPSREAAQKTFDGLLENIRIENCEYFPDVVNAILRRVPGRVEAENYGHGGPGVSFSVKDGAARARFYRTAEPVPIEPVEGGGGPGRSAQAVLLDAGEWVAFAVESLEAKECGAVLKAKAESAPSIVRLSVGGASRDVTIAGGGWTEVEAGVAAFSRGENRVKVSAESGKVRIDWIAFR